MFEGQNAETDDEATEDMESDHENLSEKKRFEFETESEDYEAVADTEFGTRMKRFAMRGLELQRSRRSLKTRLELTSLLKMKARVTGL